MPILLLCVALLILFLFLHFRRKQKRQRRIDLRNQRFPKKWERILHKEVPIYRKLPSKLREELHGHVHVFLAEKRFFGNDGIVITDKIRLIIAAQACLLLLNRTPRYFPGFQTILLYPESYRAQQVQRDGSIEIAGKQHRAGESWYRGPVILSWNEVLRGVSQPHDGYNVVLHEFAHKLDEEDHVMDGLPILSEDSHYASWAEVLRREYHLLQEKAQRGRRDVMNNYGATSPAEFFAVATETFFERPAKLKRKHPKLYVELRKFYRVDPVSWHGNAQK